MTLLMVSLFKSNSQLGQDVSGSLPDITGTFSDTDSPDTTEPWTFVDNGFIKTAGCIAKCKHVSGAHRAIKTSATGSGGSVSGFSIYASKSNDVYSAQAGENVVRPTSIGVTMWKRTA